MGGSIGFHIRYPNYTYHISPIVYFAAPLLSLIADSGSISSALSRFLLATGIPVLAVIPLVNITTTVTILLLNYDWTTSSAGYRYPFALAITFHTILLLMTVLNMTSPTRPTSIPLMMTQRKLSLPTLLSTTVLTDAYTEWYSALSSGSRLPCACNV